ncbi:MAG: M28 family peptidase [Bacteroidales bacterium]|jgi:hypothetical protein|nr:M28 family peptidase [Bacteroidales bacterium]
MKTKLLILFIIVTNFLNAQSYKYAHYCLDSLISKEFKGRGYQEDGDRKAANFIERELVKSGLKSIMNYPYQQKLPINVNNILSSTLKLHSINSSYLKLGEEFLVYGSSPTVELKIKNVKPIKIDFSKEKDLENLEKYNGKVLLFDVKEVDYVKVHSLIRLLNEKEISPQIFIIQNCDKMQFFSGRLKYNFPIIMLKDKEFSKKIDYLELSIKSNWVEDYETQNVWGMVEGKVHKDSFYVFTAHYDHLGKIGEDCFFPGANDNASGVAVLLDLAKYYSQNPSDYSIVFIFTTAEEIGLLGSKFAAENPLIDLTKVKFLFNMDMCGTGSGGIALINGEKEFDASKTMKEINETKRYFNEIRIGGESCNSDHCPFVQKGVPAFFLFTFGCEYNEYHTIYDNGEGLSFTKHLDFCNIIKDFIASHKK